MKYVFITIQNKIKTICFIYLIHKFLKKILITIFRLLRIVFKLTIYPNFQKINNFYKFYIIIYYSILINCIDFMSINFLLWIFYYQHF